MSPPPPALHRGYGRQGCWTGFSRALPLPWPRFWALFLMSPPRRLPSVPSLCRRATAPPQSDRTPSPSIAGPPYPFLPPPSQVRIWDNLIPAAQSGALSTLLTTVLNIDWSRFDALKAFVLGYVRRYETQDARKIEQNRMVLELLRLLHQLLAAGFLKAAEVAPVLPRLLALLDGREVRMPGWHAGALTTPV